MPRCGPLVYTLFFGQICVGVVSCALGIHMNLSYVREICVQVMNFSRKYICLVVVGVTTIIWAICKCRNNVHPDDPSSVITQTTYRLEFRSALQKQKKYEACKSKEQSCYYRLQLIYTTGGKVGLHSCCGLLDEP